MKNIYLIGFMGAGKSRVGKILAKMLKRRFVDTDKIIEAKTELKISEIFARQGEDFFRARERDVIKEIAQTSNQVVAVGGGVPIKDDNWQALAASGVTIYLKATADTLFRHLKRARVPRPLLSGLDDQQRLTKINEMLKEREPYYLKADITIERQNRPARKLAKLIGTILDHARDQSRTG